MKRNNVFLLSYMAFILLCLLVYAYGGFERWGAVVSAVAISSAFISYADFFSVYSKAYSTTCSAAEQFIKEREKLICEDIQAVTNMRQNINMLKSKGLDVAEEERRNEQISRMCCEMREVIKDFSVKTAKKRKQQKNFKHRAEALMFFAFLSFLCILSFSTLAELVKAAQDYISVLGFLIVLSSQYVSGIFEDMLQKDQNRHDCAVETHNCAREQLFELQKKYIELAERVNNYAD